MNVPERLNGSYDDPGRDRGEGGKGGGAVGGVSGKSALGLFLKSKVVPELWGDLDEDEDDDPPPEEKEGGELTVVSLQDLIYHSLPPSFHLTSSEIALEVQLRSYLSASGRALGSGGSSSAGSSAGSSAVSSAVSNVRSTATLSSVELALDELVLKGDLVRVVGRVKYHVGSLSGRRAREGNERLKEGNRRAKIASEGGGGAAEEEDDDDDEDACKSEKREPNLSSTVPGGYSRERAVPPTMVRYRRAVGVGLGRAGGADAIVRSKHVKIRKPWKIVRRGEEGNSGVGAGGGGGGAGGGGYES